jgi:hypothetical protein
VKLDSSLQSHSRRQFEPLSVCQQVARATTAPLTVDIPNNQFEVGRSQSRPAFMKDIRHVRIARRVELRKSCRPRNSHAWRGFDL